MFGTINGAKAQWKVFLRFDFPYGRQNNRSTPAIETCDSKITPEHDDLISVSSAGTITVENLGGRED
jgi:hypothetical protein